MYFMIYYELMIPYTIIITIKKQPLLVANSFNFSTFGIAPIQRSY